MEGKIEMNVRHWCHRTEHRRRGWPESVAATGRSERWEHPSQSSPSLPACSPSLSACRPAPASIHPPATATARLYTHAHAHVTKTQWNCCSFKTRSWRSNHTWTVWYEMNSGRAQNLTTSSSLPECVQKAQFTERWSKWPKLQWPWGVKTRQPFRKHFLQNTPAAVLSEMTLCFGTQGPPYKSNWWTENLGLTVKTNDQLSS